MRRYFLLILAGAWLLVPSAGAAQTPSNEKAIADFYWRTGHYQTAMFYVQAQENRAKKEPAKQATALDQLIAEALKNNPDIAVADAKVREVEAEARRVRMKVAGDISLLHAEIEAAKAAEKEAQALYNQAEQL